MREDLNKVLCESPRQGGLDFHWYRTRKEKYIDEPYEDYDDDMPHSGDSSRGRVGIRSSKVYWNGRRQFNEHLNPLRGIIRKNVGRPWDKVYGELCKVFDKRSVINQHILLHLAQYVNTKDIVVKDGKLYEQTRYRRSRSDVNFENLVPIRESSIEWFVDPRTGILRENKHRVTWKQQRKLSAERNKKAQLETKREYDNGATELKRMDNGVWWIFKHEFYNQIQDWIDVPVYDKELRQNIYVKKWGWTYPEAREYGGNIVRAAKVCILAKQMNSRELKQYGVENRPLETVPTSNAKLKKLERRLTKSRK